MQSDRVHQADKRRDVSSSQGRVTEPLIAKQRALLFGKRSEFALQRENAPRSAKSNPEYRFLTG